MILDSRKGAPVSDFLVTFASAAGWLYLAVTDRLSQLFAYDSDSLRGYFRHEEGEEPDE